MNITYILDLLIALLFMSLIVLALVPKQGVSTILGRIWKRR